MAAHLMGGPIRHHNFMLPHFKPAVINAGLPSDVRFRARASVADALDATNRGHLADVPRTEGSIVPLRGRSQSKI
jgi:hypothetical protein